MKQLIVLVSMVVLGVGIFSVINGDGIKGNLQTIWEHEEAAQQVYP